MNFQGNKGFKTYTCPAMATNYLGLDVAVKPLDNKLARQAINYAVDKQAIVDAVYFGLGMPARGPLSPVIWGFDPNRGYAYPYNPEKARELLAEAGLADAASGERRKQAAAAQVADTPDDAQGEAAPPPAKDPPKR